MTRIDTLAGPMAYLWVLVSKMPFALEKYEHIIPRYLYSLSLGFFVFAIHILTYLLYRYVLPIKERTIFSFTISPNQTVYIKIGTLCTYVFLEHKRL